MTASDASDMDQRIESALGELGAEHDPPSDWEARVFAAIAEQRIGEQLAQLGDDLVPPPGWEDRVIAATRTAPWRPARWLAMPALAAAAAVVLWIALPAPALKTPTVAYERVPDPEAEKTRSGGSRDSTRGETITSGSTVRVSTKIKGRYRALWIYDGNHRLVLTCPDNPACDRSDNQIVATLPSVQIPGYSAVAIVSNDPIPEPSGDADKDIDLARHAGGLASEPLPIPVK